MTTTMVGHWQRDEGGVDLEGLLGIPEWGIEVAVTCLFLGWFFIGCQFYSTEKQRAYLVAVLNGSVCVVAGVYVCWELGGDFRFMVRFFRVAQIVDVVLGLLYYPSQLFFLTTWVHHSAYTLLCNWMLRRNVSILFAVCLVEEIPTLIMSLGRIERSLRWDTGFGVSYLLLRLVLHTWLVYNVMIMNTDNDKIAVIRFNFMLTWCLHANWFRQYMNQQMRRWRASSSSSTTPKTD